jgi:hypothetical protein
MEPLRPWMLTMEAWMLKKEHGGPVIADSHHFGKEQDADPVPDPQ